MSNGDIPLDWTKKPLGAVAAIVRDSVLPHDIVSGTSYVGLEHIDGEGRFVGVKAVSNGELASNKFAFSADHILYGKLRPYLKKIARPSFSGVCSTDILPLRPVGEIDRGYLFHYLRQQHLVDLATARSTGANLPRLSPKQLEAFPVAYPTLSEQRRIASILDKADGIRRRREEGLRLTDELLRSTFLDMFGDPVANPKGWPMAPFPDVCESRLGKMLDAKKCTGKMSRPYMRNFNVQWGRLDLSSVFEMDFAEDEKHEFRLKFGDVLVCEGGAGVGQTAIWHDELPECYFQKSLHRLRPKPSTATSQYVASLMWFLVQSGAILGAISSATIPHLTGERLKTVRVPLPPFSEQLRYETIAYSVASLRSARNNAASEASALFDSIVQRAFRGEL